MLARSLGLTVSRSAQFALFFFKLRLSLLLLFLQAAALSSAQTGQSGVSFLFSPLLMTWSGSPLFFCFLFGSATSLLHVVSSLFSLCSSCPNLLDHECYQEGKWAIVFALLSLDLPSAPGIPIFLSSTTTISTVQINFYFAASSDASHYHVFVTSMSSGIRMNWGTFVDTESSDPVYFNISTATTCGILLPGSFYKIRVKACNSQGCTTSLLSKKMKAAGLAPRPFFFSLLLSAARIVWYPNTTFQISWSFQYLRSLCLLFTFPFSVLDCGPPSAPVGASTPSCPSCLYPSACSFSCMNDDVGGGSLICTLNGSWIQMGVCDMQASTRTPAPPTASIPTPSGSSIPTSSPTTSLIGQPSSTPSPFPGSYEDS